MKAEEAIAIVNEHLGLGAGITFKSNAVKFYAPDEEGGRSKAYLTAEDCFALAAAFKFLGSCIE